MYKKFDTLQGTLRYLFVTILVFLSFIIYLLYKDEMQILHVFLVFCIAFYLPIYIYYFRDYKLIIDNEKVEFFYLYTKKKSLLWSHINKIEIEKEVMGFAKQKTQLVHFCSNNCICSFNISNIDKEEFLELLIKLCSDYSIPIKYRD